LRSAHAAISASVAESHPEPVIDRIRRPLMRARYASSPRGATACPDGSPASLVGAGDLLPRM
jgi:hypothetical protein